MIHHCTDCGQPIDPRYSSHDCDDDLYGLVTSVTGISDEDVLVETHNPVGDREYADVLITLDCRGPVADALHCGGTTPRWMSWRRARPVPRFP